MKDLFDEKLFYGGDVVTMENPDDVPEAVLVRNGTIAEVGNLEELKEKASSQVTMVDLKGQTLMPAFIDAHSHIRCTVEYSTMVDLTNAESFDDIVKMMTDFKIEHDLTHGEIIFGYCYDHNFLKEQTYPNREILDKVSTESPVAIWHASVHMAVVNSKALEVMGIDENTPDPEGGWIERYEGTQKPTGYLEELAIVPVQKLQAQMPMDYVKQMEEAQMVYIRNGITTIQDGDADWRGVDLVREMATEGRLVIDQVAYLCHGWGYGIGDAMEKNKDCINHYVNRYKIGGYKTILDGSPQARTAWMSKPYEGETEYCSAALLTDEEVEREAKLAIEEGLPLLAHCNGDAASEQFLRCYEKMFDESDNPDKANLRPVMIHCQTVRDDQLDRMKKLGMIPSIFIGHVNYWGDIHLKNFGQERGSRISPVKSALDRDLMYNFHTDAPVVQPDLLHAVWTAVNRITRRGVLCGADQRIGVYDALKAITINAAYTYFEEDIKGSIKKGKMADLVILDRNPLKVDKMDIKNIKVMETIKEGKTLYRKE